MNMTLQEEVDYLRERVRQLEEILYKPVEESLGMGLTPQEERLVSHLIRRAPGYVTKDALMTVLYDDADEEPQIKIIDVFICKIRKKLVGHGWHIETVWGRGYRILEGEDETDRSGWAPDRQRQPNYTDAEDAIIRQSGSLAEAAARLPHRSTGGIWSRANRIGHRWQRKPTLAVA